MPTKVYAGNLPPEISEKKIQDIFSTYGEIKEFDIIKNFAFIHYTKEEDAEKAVKNLHKTKLDNHTINVEISKAINRSNPPTKVHVGNLPENFPSAELKQIFQAYGDLQNVDVIKNYAFVHFKNKSDAEKAANDLNNSEIQGKTIEVKIARNQTPKSDLPPPGARRFDSPQGNEHHPPQNRMSYPPSSQRRDYPQQREFPPQREFAQQREFSQRDYPQQREFPPQRERPQQPGYPPQTRSLPPAELPLRHHAVPEPLPVARMAPQEPAPVAKPAPLGYVIYERYYVDPDHSLLKGLPLPKFPKLESQVARATDSPAHVSVAQNRPITNNVAPPARHDPYPVDKRPSLRPAYAAQEPAIYRDRSPPRNSYAF